MEFPLPPPPDDEALLHELSDLLGDLPEVPEDIAPEQLVTGALDVPEAPGPLVEAADDVTADTRGRVADQHLPTLAQMVRSLNERIALARSASLPGSGVAREGRYLTFSIGDRRCGVRLENVVEVSRVLPIVPLPRVPEWLLGLGNLRGQVVALIDLARFLGVGALQTIASRRLIVVRHAGGELVGGFVVDAVHRIRDFPPASVRGPDEGAAWLDPAYLLGFCDERGEPVALLDMTRLLSSDGLRQYAA